MLSQMKSQFRKEVAPYEQASKFKSFRQLINTIIPFLLLWIFAYLSLSISYALTLVFAIVAAGVLVRIFIIFHDCTHYSFFKNRGANEVLGLITGILTFHGYHKWKHTHTAHHAISGNLNKRSPGGNGDIWMMTVEEYIAASKWQRFTYRFYRNPFVMFVIGPFFIMLLLNRINRREARMGERLNTYITNLSLAALVGGLCWLIGWQSFLLIQIPIFYVSSAAGIWIFYVQHQFEDGYFEREEEWNFVQAAVEGSSYYKLPKILQWLTGNIGFHHVHHLSPRVPNYNLEKAHMNTPALQSVTTISLLTSLKSIRFRLWDEAEKKFVRFSDIRHQLG